MLGMTSNYNSNDHSFIGGEIGHYVNRLAKESGRDLTVIRYNKLGVFCIIEMLSPNRDVFIDLMNLGKSLANFNRAKNHELQHRLFKPLTCDETSVGIAEAESRHLHDMQAWNEEEGERLAKCAKGE